jgi:hypothetical protein
MRALLAAVCFSITFIEIFARSSAACFPLPDTVTTVPPDPGP